MHNDTEKNKPIVKIAVVGSAGSGKTTLCSQAAHTTEITFPQYNLQWLDVQDPELLPDLHPDVILQVVDCSDLEESLVLTPQLIDMHVKLVLALNRYDQLLATDHSLAIERFGYLLGVQVVPTNASTGSGVVEMTQMVLDAYEGKANTSRHIHVEYGTDVEEAIADILEEVSKIPDISNRYSRRFISIRLLERPEMTLALLRDVPNIIALAYTTEKNRRKLEKQLGQSAATLIHEARHGFIHGALNETLHHSQDNSDHTRQQKIDKVLTNKWLGFPILIIALYLVFQFTFTIGAYPQQWIQTAIDTVCQLLSGSMPDNWFSSLLIDGIVQGIGAVLAFLPNIIILFFFISLMEDSGYMARVAFLMDKIMHKVGLHGRSFVPMLVGFGCNVPAIMAARSIDNKKDRTLTMLMIPFMSCGARLPVYMLFVGAFFQQSQAIVMLSLYLIGIVLSILFALLMKQTKYFKKTTEDFVSELPAFRLPTLRNTGAHIWERCADYLKKISTVILWASIIIWALYYFPRNEELTQPYDEQIAQWRAEMPVAETATNGYYLSPADHAFQQACIAIIDSLSFEKEAVRKENSALAVIGKWLTPIMRPLGFDWRMNVCILTGLPAKEAIVSTMSILYHQKEDAQLTESLRTNPFFSPLKAYAFMLFVLLYFPCIATIATLRREIGRGWAAFTVVHSLCLAWLVAFLVFQVGSLF